MNGYLFIQTLNLNAITDRCGYEKAIKFGFGGFAQVYLAECSRENDEVMDAPLYKKLIEIDTCMGTSSSMQLFWCLNYTTRKDLITVRSSRFDTVVVVR